jgi:1,4-dihydroxy-2-naphthoate polyprenyltransferase
MMKTIQPWIDAARPKTLPLALASTLLGSFLAAAEHLFRWNVFFLAALTTVLLQILSNLANDYGDFANGKDNADRVGPRRMVQSGAILPATMRHAIILVTACTLAVGLALIAVGTEGSFLAGKVFFVILGIASIAAALKYTIGHNPYGYRGWGDLSVFLFFGIAGTVGTYSLHTHRISADVFLPAACIGFLSTGVLNINNLRDETTDQQTGKRTLVVLLGRDRAKIYQAILLTLAILSGCLYTFMNFQSGIQFLFLCSLPFLVKHVHAIARNTSPGELNVELKNLSLSTLLFSITFGLGLIFR